MTKEKIVGYTEELAAQVKAAYIANGNNFTDADCLKFDKGLRSLTAHASRAGYYIRQEKIVKGGAGIKKDELVELIAYEMGIDSEQLAGLEKSTRQCLNLIYNYIKA